MSMANAFDQHPALIALTAAIEAATLQTDGAPDSIAVRSVAAHEWSNACMGCHEETGCPEVMMPGYIIGLTGQGRYFDYHVSRSGTARLCSSGPDAPASPLFKRWLLADSANAVDVYRAEDIKVGRFRGALRFFRDGVYIAERIGAADPPVLEVGYWELVGADQISLRLEGQDMRHYFRIVSLEERELQLEVLRTA